MENIKVSYSAAGEIPLKILLNEDTINSIKKEGIIPMTHLQICPTNACNQNCSFCSCSNRDKNLELSYRQIMDIMGDARICGCEAVTITGGGEPLMHQKINEIIQDTCNLGIQVGLVTNGILLECLTDETLKCITWIRISSGDDREFSDEYAKMIEGVIDRGRNVDWAFSHVVSRNPSYETICKLVDFANKHDFTHVRLVTDLLDLGDESRMEFIKRVLAVNGIDDNRVNYQDRLSYTHGRKDCLISLLKPVIDAGGYITPCCGVQYALENLSRDFEKTMRMGKSSELKRIHMAQEHFDGSQCVKCYYDKYNSLLGILKGEIKHKKFV